ncbi:hypothetical protein BJX61DRAFT_530242 [Aspergillus egyptiacus]|nr:hypothetical protein BJX61DRAFT_530242 [Aspergillus egyptiacus]
MSRWTWTGIPILRVGLVFWSMRVRNATGWLGERILGETLGLAGEGPAVRFSERGGLIKGFPCSSFSLLCLVEEIVCCWV